MSYSIRIFDKTGKVHEVKLSNLQYETVLGKDHVIVIDKHGDEHIHLKVTSKDLLVQIQGHTILNFEDYFNASPEEKPLLILKGFQEEEITTDRLLADLKLMHSSSEELDNMLKVFKIDISDLNLTLADRDPGSALIGNEIDALILGSTDSNKAFNTFSILPPSFHNSDFLANLLAQSLPNLPTFSQQIIPTPIPLPENDTVSYINETGAVNVNLLTHIATGPFGTQILPTAIRNVIGSNFNDIIIGDNNNNILQGINGNDTITGNGGNDVIIDIQGTNILDGGTGNDSITDNGNNSTLIGGQGNDTLQGNSINDYVSYASSPNGINVNLGTGLVSNDGFGTQDTIVVGSIPNAIGSGQADIIIGNSAANTLIGLAGNDILNGGAGIDTVDYSASPGSVVVNLTANTASDGYGNTDTLSSIENVIGSINNDIITGSTLDNVLSGGNGNDTLDGSTGNDTLYGEAGDDTLVGGAGNDILDGGTGINMASYISFTAAVNVNLNTGIATSSNIGTDTLSNIQNINGSSSSDILTGNAANNVMFGNSGNDTLSGLDGEDTLDGGLGINILLGGNNDDILIYHSTDSTINGGTGINTLRLDSSTTHLTLNGAADAVLSTVQIIDLLTDSTNQTLTINPTAIAGITGSSNITVTGDSNDAVQLSNQAGSWNLSSTPPGLQVWSYTGIASATAIISSAVSVTTIT